MSEQILADSAREVLTTAAHAAVSPVPSGPCTGGDLELLIAMLSMVGSKPGTLVLFCESPTASSLTSGMLSMPAGDLDDEMVTDALGELVNQIAGTIKRKLAASGAEIMLSVPSVVRGTGVALRVLADKEPLAVDLQVDGRPVSLRFWRPKNVQG